MNILSAFDIYGSQFQFKFFGNDQFKTFLGFFFSFCTLVTVVVLIPVLGSDLFMKQNPKIMTQMATIPDQEYDIKNFGNSGNFTIAWRIEDESGAAVSFQNLLYSLTTINSNNAVIESRVCTELPLLDPFFVNKIANGKPSDWNCLNLNTTQMNIIPLWRNQLHFSFKLSYCNASLCTSYDKLNEELILKTKNIRLAVPEHMFDSSDSINPLQIGYVQYVRGIDLNLLKEQQINLRRVYLIRDDWPIFSNEQNCSYIVKTSTMTDVQKFLTREQYGTEKNLFIFNFIFDGKFDSYKISFLKIDELLASIGSLLSLEMTFFAFISSFYNSYYMSYTIYDQFFDYSQNPKCTIQKSDIEIEISNKRGELEVKNFKSGALNPKIVKLIKPRSDEQHQPQHENGDDNVGVALQQHIYTEEADGNPDKVQDNDAYSPSSSKKFQPVESNATKYKKLISIDDLNVIKTDTTLQSHTFKDLIAKSREKMDKELTEKLKKNLEALEAFENKISDFKNFTNLFIEFELIKMLILNEQQNLTLKLNKKINLSCMNKSFYEHLFFDETQGIEAQKHADLLNYYLERIQSNSLTETDKFLYNLLSDAQKDLISSFVNQ